MGSVPSDPPARERSIDRSIAEERKGVLHWYGTERRRQRNATQFTTTPSQAKRARLETLVAAFSRTGPDRTGLLSTRIIDHHAMNECCGWTTDWLLCVYGTRNRIRALMDCCIL
eukprot:jgi/Psemu1/316633/fgenesh1_kg.3703_\